MHSPRILFSNAKSPGQLVHSVSSNLPLPSIFRARAHLPARKSSCRRFSPHRIDWQIKRKVEMSPRLPDTQLSQSKAYERRYIFHNNNSKTEKAFYPCEPSIVGKSFFSRRMNACHDYCDVSLKESCALRPPIMLKAFGISGCTFWCYQLICFQTFVSS